MKKKVLVIVFIVFGIAMTNAQDRDQDQDRDRIQDRFMLVDGDVLQIRDRDQIRLNDEYVLSDATIVNPNGIFQTKDWKQLRLKDGECLDMDGIKYRNEYQYRYKVKQENKGLSQAQIQERNRDRSVLMQIDGNVYLLKNQFQKQLQQRYNFANGGFVDTDGSYLTRDRKQLRLMDGECLNIDGEKFKNMYAHRKMETKKNMISQKKIMSKKMPKKSIKGHRKANKGF
jgi:hypothetical protein